MAGMAGMAVEAAEHDMGLKEDTVETVGMIAEADIHPVP